MQQIEEPEEKEELDEYIEDEEFIEEDYEESGERRSRGPTGRTVTLQMLLSSGILQPGEGLMAIEYLGQRFIGDLLPDGKIKSQETDIIFASPSAWAINCKRIINPEKKSGCGWASIKYRGKKLDAYKNAYFKKKKQEITKENHVSEDEEIEKEKVTPPSPAPIIIQRVVHKHNILGNRSPAHEGNTLIECSSFPSLGKIQPFLVTLTSNAAIVLDLHCHLTSSEVVGYLAGHWDVNAHNVHITHAFPCRTRTTDREMAPLVEADVRRAIEQRQLTLVGWYHSHPMAPATPTLRDIDMQLDHQLKMKGSNDASYTPCIAFICSPYIPTSPVLDSAMTCYWVMPPPESRPHEYGRPMHMNFNIMQDNFLSQDSLTEIKKCVDFYKAQHDFIKFSEKYKENVTYIEKLKSTLHNKFPRDQGDGVLWGFICEMVCPGINPNSVVISEPSLPPPATSTSISSPVSAASGHPVTSCPSSSHVNLLVPNLSYTTSVLKASAVASTSSASMLMPSDIANALFAATGRFPSGSLADPARSALTSMFLPPLSSYKLDPLSMLKPMPSTSKSSTPSDSASDKNCTVTSGHAL